MEEKELSDKEDILKLNKYKILRRTLALESFDDDMSIDKNPSEIVKANRKLADYAWRIVGDFWEDDKKEKTTDELINITSEVLEKLENIFTKIGREKFVFYEDGDVDYAWVNIPKKKK